MNTLGNNNISTNFKMPRDKPTIDNVIEGFLIQDPDWIQQEAVDTKYKQVEILWITKNGSIKSRKIRYLSAFHKKLMRVGKVPTFNTPYIRTSGGYLKKRIQVVSLIQEEGNEQAEKNKMVAFKLDDNRQREGFSTAKLGVIKTLKLVLEVFAGEMVVLSAGQAFYTLSDVNVNTLTDRIESLMGVSNSQIQKEIEEIVGSDRAFLVNLNYFPEIVVEKLDFVDLDIDGNPLENPNGSFFKYHHKFKNLDLDKYGIFRNNIEDDEFVNKLEENCLIRALREGGMSDVKVARLKSFVFNRSIPMCKIKMICELLKIHILVKRNDNNHSHYEYGKEFMGVEDYVVGLVDSHYFIVDDVPITKYALKNIFDVENEGENWNCIIDKHHHKKYDRFIDSYNLVKFLQANKETHLVPIEMNLSILKTQFYDKIIDTEVLEYDEEGCCKLNEWDEEKEKWKRDKLKKPIIWFDFETDPNSKRHLPILCCSEDEAGNKKTFFNDYYRKDVKDGDGKIIHYKGTCKYNCGKKFLDSITSEKILLVAHNAGYDYRFLVKYLFNIKQITKGSGLMNATAFYCNQRENRNVEVEIKDSYKLISMPLRGFGKCFKMPISKEVMPYTLYTQSNIKKKFCRVIDARPHLKSEEDYRQLLENIDKTGCGMMIEGVKYFDIMKYCEWYCRLDVSVLKEGYLIFRGWLIEAFDIDINFVWTIASLANKVLLKKGCYEGVYQLAGVPRMFIQKCVVGGRTMCRDNIKFNLKDCNVADYDGVSLYPSACVRLGSEYGGFLLGKPKVLKRLTYDFLKQQDGYFVKIKINAVHKPRHFSLISSMSEAGVRVFDNDAVGKEFYVDRTTLEDWIEFMGIEFDVIRGYYYNEGRNNQILPTMSGMFNERLKKKADKNPIQVVYKLIMNASYGKAILKPIKTDEKVINTTADKDKFVQKNYNSIIEYQQLYDCDKWVVKVLKPINDHFNNAPVGVEILSMSKRIMNEVMCLAEDNDLKIYYQDTDSMHIDYDDVEVLEKKFQEKYHRILTGKQLGQFHIDFDLKGAVKDIKAINSIFLGKKCYIDELQSEDADGNIITDYHIRMKGVPNATILYTAEQRNQTLLELYQDLYDGEAIEFDLLCGGKRCNFKFHKDMTIESMQEFKRTLSF